MSARYLRTALDGDATSQLYMGALYLAGVGGSQSDPDAFYWFSQAAKQGQPTAQVVVSELYLLGRGVAKSNIKAYFWARCAADNSNQDARRDADQLLDRLLGNMSSEEFSEATRPASDKECARSAKDPHDEVIRQNPDNADTYFRRGQARAQDGQYALAEEDFGRAIHLNPNDAKALNDRCWVRAMQGLRLQEALADCDKAIRLQPEFAEAFDSRGLVHLKLSQNNLAILNYSTAIKLNPKLASAFYGRGTARRRQGAPAAGNADIEAAIRIDPDVYKQFSGVPG